MPRPLTPIDGRGNIKRGSLLPTHYGKTGHATKKKTAKRAARKKKIEDWTDISSALSIPKAKPLNTKTMDMPNVAGSLAAGIKSGRAIKRMRTRRKAKKA